MTTHSAERRVRFGLIGVAVGLLVLLTGLRALASLLIEYRWWDEVGQVSTWISMALYRVVPVAVAVLVAFLAFWIAHARALKFAGTGLRSWPRYARLSSLALLVFSILFGLATVDTWTVVRYFGGSSAGGAAGYVDPVFGRPLSFYFFDLPFYELALKLWLSISAITVILYWLTARLWQLRSRFTEVREGPMVLELADLNLAGALQSAFLRNIVVLFLVALAARFYLDRFTMLYNDHRYLVGVDYVNELYGLPLQWLVIGCALLAAVLVAIRRGRWAAWLALALVVQIVVPRVVSIFVRPNEISLQKPYIDRHIQATRQAYGLHDRVREIEFPAQLEAPVDMAKHRAALENVRLWDWRAFHDTVTQIQALRPYYVFKDSDVDRYTVNGQIRQVLVTPREIDVRELPQAQARWVNPHLIYTHGYGLVMAEANRIAADGSPELLIQNAPPEVRAKGLQVTRPELYYGETLHEPVFVRTRQQEFDYPSGADNVHTRYEGKGGFPVASFGMRLAAALHFGDWNILIAGDLTGESRMMIHRQVRERLVKLAGFMQWDQDPYLVLSDSGRLVWMVDGYTTSSAHPYSRSVATRDLGQVNYVRNSVKATVDAYDGDMRLYIFDSADPIIQAYSRLFPALFRPGSEMPADVRRHTRYPEPIFLAQAEMYRTFHMRNPESFYNNEDLWNFARGSKTQAAEADIIGPTYVLATLPGQSQPEFLLMIPFTPRGKDNLIGLMMARCDGEHLGELVFLQLSKQSLIYGPAQVSALIDQEQNISKDLTLWNQQGSQVLRGQMLVLPVENTFLYIQPIYIQSQSARLPQLKKIVLAMGKRLIYRDTYDEALRDLSGGTFEASPAGGTPSEQTAAPATPPAPGAPPVSATPPPQSDRRIETIRGHLQRYRELSSQGRWAEAGKELEAVEAAVRR